MGGALKKRFLQLKMGPWYKRTEEEEVAIKQSRDAHNGR